MARDEGRDKQRSLLKPLSPLDYSTLTPEEALSALGSAAEGLSAEEAGGRLAAYGSNELPRERAAWYKILRSQFSNPMFLILLLVAGASGFLGQPQQSAIILFILGISVALGFYNEFRAARLVEELQGRASIKAVVTRGGAAAEVDSSSVVPGDLLSVYIGDIVAADARIIDSRELEVDESLLTGESYAVEKNPRVPAGAPPTSPSQATDMVFMGTVVVRGSGRAVVVSTGRSTAFGSMSKSLARAHPETEFQRGTKKYGNLLLLLTFFLAIGIFGFNALVGHSLLNSLLFSLAVAIGIVPELMPGIVTIALSRGAHRMAREQVVVKRLAAMENLGNIDVLCTDKTGTLTEGRIVLDSVLGADLKPGTDALQLALVCNAAVVGADGKVTGNAIDVATWEYAVQRSAQGSASGFSKVDEIPFDYERRMMTVVARHGGETLLVTKGAPESILPRCTRVATGAGPTQGEELSPDLSGRLQGEVAGFSQRGLRVLAVSCKSVEARSAYSHEDESGLTLVGFLSFTDPPKRDAALAVSRLGALGVGVKILTGDNELVARRTCEEIGIRVDRLVTGGDLVAMSWADFKSASKEATIFARVTPEQKLDVIRALKENGHVVGYMGDGVNDAPALYEADAGISVDSAVDVSKGAADIILLRKDLSVLAGGIEEGRRTFGNTMKYVLMGTSSNFGNMFSASAASVFLPFLPMLPMQILFMNLLYNVANLTLPTDNVDPEYTEWPRRWDIGFVRNFTLFFGPFSSVYDFLTFGIMLFIFGASASLFQSGWFVESFWTEVLIIFVIRTRRIPFFTSRPGGWLTVLTLACVAFGTVLPFTALGAFMGFVPLPPLFWALNILMTVTYLFLVDAGKVFFYRVCGY